MSLVTKEELQAVRNRVNSSIRKELLSLTPKTKLDVKIKRDKLDFDIELERINKSFSEL